MLRFFLICFSLIFTSISNANIKEKIIKNFENIDNLQFNFEQNINGKTENGSCKLKYPKKIFCKYNVANGKILVSDGKSLVIKTRASYYQYPLRKTPLNLILDKEFLISKLNHLEESNVQGSYINYLIKEKDNNINIFFDNKTFDLIGWQNKDIYQNYNITFISSIEKNINLPKNIFKIPSQN